MKKAFILTLICCTALISSCGTSASYSSYMEDGIYYRPNDTQKLALAKEDKQLADLSAKTTDRRKGLSSVATNDTIILGNHNTVDISYEPNTTYTVLLEGESYEERFNKFNDSTFSYTINLVVDAPYPYWNSYWYPYSYPYSWYRGPWSYWGGYYGAGWYDPFWGPWDPHWGGPYWGPYYGGPYWAGAYWGYGSWGFGFGMGGYWGPGWYDPYWGPGWGYGGSMSHGRNEVYARRDSHNGQMLPGSYNRSRTVNQIRGGGTRTQGGPTGQGVIPNKENGNPAAVNSFGTRYGDRYVQNNTVNPTRGQSASSGSGTTTNNQRYRRSTSTNTNQGAFTRNNGSGYTRGSATGNANSNYNSSYDRRSNTSNSFQGTRSNNSSNSSFSTSSSSSGRSGGYTGGGNTGGGGRSGGGNTGGGRR